MQSGDKYIDKPDDFSQKVGEKLREHRMPVGSDVWESLTEKLPPEKRRIPLYLPWAAASVAVVGLILFFLIDGNGPGSGKSREQVRYSDANNTIKQEGKEKTTDILDGKESVAETPESKGIPALEETLGLAEISEPSEGRKSAPKTSYQEKNAAFIVEVKPEDSLQLERDIHLEELKGPENISSAEEPVKSEIKLLPVEDFLAEVHLSAPVKEHHAYRSFMASLGGGSTSLDFSLGDDYVMNDPQQSDAFPRPGDGLGVENGAGGGYYLLNPSDYTDVVHRLPVSFSLTANFPVGRNVALETGLSYTYLFSRFKRDGNIIYRGTLQQHYIGIPVNLRYIVWQNDTWNMYLLGGGSIEKGLRSIYKQEIEYNGGDIIHTNVYSGIDGFQFSAQAGTGFSYRLRDNLDLFGEPRIVYYFRNNQPMSARTENPLIFGLNMGIRLRFK